MFRVRSSLLLSVLLLGGPAAAPARATDTLPCGDPVSKPWSSERVQPCPLTGALPPNGWVPMYHDPVAVAPGQPLPRADAWLHGTTDQYFVCDAHVPSASYTHPNGRRNDWWAYTQADGSNFWGWVPEVYFDGAGDDEPDGGLRRCPTTPQPLLPAPVPPAGTPQPPAAPSPSPSPDPLCSPEPTVTTAATLVARARAMRAGAQRGRGPTASRITVRYGRAAEVLGVLRDPAGAPIAHAPICFLARPDGQDGPFLELARTTTDATGRYSVSVPPGPSRELLAVHRVGAVSVVSRSVIKVRPRLTARLSRRRLRNGQTLRITGQVRGGPFPRRGVLVNLQAIKLGSWAGFSDPVRTDARGRYTFRYRFQLTGVTQTYRLRTRVLAQSGYPYVTGASRELRVRVLRAPAF